jgi:phosphoserine phosphatase
MTRPRALLVLDVEGTLFESTVRLPGVGLDSTMWQGIASILGEQAERDEIETHRVWDSGGYANYIEWMTATIQMHLRHGLTRPIFNAVIERAQYHPHVVDILRAIDRSRFEFVIVSGGFRELARRAQTDLAVRHAFAACEYIFDSEDRLVGYNLLPCDFSGKLDFVRLLLREYGLNDQDWVFIGHGGNDVAIAREAPFSIGFRPHPELARAVDVSIDDYRELPAVLDGQANHVGRVSEEV